MAVDGRWVAGAGQAESMDAMAGRTASDSDMAEASSNSPFIR